ncbi:STAS domain-containing protein [Streptomyces sp. SID13588]|uniref:STAS domain-containing protein n=1 Tax=Streptomyces sp. SID13588 TaxID=2706051 RepID=UPI0013CA3BE2|nr:STAS domain-containing protein [Streptomyces sp. SID13588]NEA72726.1 STAS domain-containing protein [Streptomyces sp. SID13588]
MPVLHSLNLNRLDHGTRTTITLAGEMDLAVAPPVRTALEACLREGIRTIDIDLTDLTFCDISGLNVFLDAARDTVAVGGSLYLHHPQRAVARVLDLTGTCFLLQTPALIPGGRAENDPGTVYPNTLARGWALWRAGARAAPPGRIHGDGW